MHDANANTGGHGRIEFSLVSAVYNVARYLDDFIASVEAQTLDLSRVEVIMVDDGSTDDTPHVLADWQERRPDLVTVITKENGGQSSARNVGLDAARGRWVTFPDPDDVLAPDYLERVARFIEAEPEVDLVGCARWMLDDATGAVTDTHPLRQHFSGGDRLRNLAENPQHFFGSAPAAFFRRDRLDDMGLRFDTDIRPNFEDGALCVRYLVGSPGSPRVGFVGTAHYHYRKRSDASSTLQTSLSHPGRYTHVLEDGYLAVLRESVDETGRPPEWLQNYILYELSWYFSSQDGTTTNGSAETAAVVDEYHALFRQIRLLLDDDVIEAFTVRRLKRVWKDIILHSYADEPWRTPYARVDRVDADQDLTRIVYQYTGDTPVERVQVNGVDAAPRHAKVRDIAYHGRVLMRERILWVTARANIRIVVDGQRLPFRFDQPPSAITWLKPGRVRAEMRALEPPHPMDPPPAAVPESTRAERALVRIARSRLARKYHDSWALMDRIHDADDSAERLFRYLRDERPDINAWFVLEEGTPDWQRLEADGYRDRLVAHGSREWKLLLLNCRHLISSHADAPVVRPPEIMRLTRPRWRFIFLQHGVIKDDLSGWLNPKQIDLFITSTPQEHASIAGDHTAYTFTTKETALTGLPRFDRLREIGHRVGPEERDLVLIVPTWRHWLQPPLEPGSQRRTVHPEVFDSEFMRSWMAVLEAEDLAKTCDARGLKIGFLPHPNLQPALDAMQLPPHVVPLSYHGQDVQQLFARAAVLVTDYSSIAFNAAYIDRPVVYFQFDQKRVLSGGHVGRKGYFTYERDGFGPVTYDAETAVAETVASLEHGHDPRPEYAARIAATFPQRDGKCCERVTAAIEASTRRVAVAEAIEAVPTPGQP